MRRNSQNLSDIADNDPGLYFSIFCVIFSWIINFSRQRRRSDVIKLIACDIDGTVLEPEDKYLPAVLLEQIERLMQKGILFSFCSGRQFANLRTLAKHLAERVYYICDNGAIVYAPGEPPETISITAMDHADALSIARTVIQTPGLELEASGPNTGYIYGKSDAFYEVMHHYVGMNLISIGSPEDIPEEILKISVYSRSAEEIYPLFQEKWGHKYRVAIAGSHWMDITCSDKGTGIRALCRHLGVALDSVLAFGDTYNDMPILDLVGWPYIKENAPKELLHRYPKRFSNVADILKRL